MSTQVFVVVATDPDQNQNGEVTYSLQDTSPNTPFEISSTGGVISVSGELDYEEQIVYTVRNVVWAWSILKPVVTYYSITFS